MPDFSGRRWWKLAALFSKIIRNTWLMLPCDPLQQPAAALQIRLQLRQQAGRMGFLSKLFGMPSFGGATNALLVELTLPTLTESQRAQLKVRLVEVFRTCGPSHRPAEIALADLNQATRLAQLNVLALAMKELGYKPPLKKEVLHKVRDPFDPSLADESALRAVARRLKWKHGVEIWIGSEPISFDSW